MKNSQNDQQQDNNLLPTICPKCGKQEIVFLTEHHKCLAARIFQSAIFVAFSIIFIVFIQDLFTTQSEQNLSFYLMGLIVAFSICQIAKHVIENQTHIQCVCRNCGNIWLLN